MKEKGRYREVPTGSYPELDQAAVILSRSQHKQDAAAFLDYLKSADARAILQRYGFSLPGDTR
jgi:molybdate transport system substrate-binding protein